MRPLATLATLVTLAALPLLAACSKEKDPSPPVPERHEGATAQSRAAPKPAGGPTEVRYETPEGVVIHATLRPGPTPDTPLVLLVHQLGKDRAEWKPVVDALSEPPGLATLALDLRGHGASTTTRDGRTLAWSQFDKQAWEGTVLDVIAALDYVDRRSDLSPSRIVGAGSSIGSSAILAAAGKDLRLAAVALLSPGRAYRGVDAMGPLRRMGDRPLLALAAEEEKPSAETARLMAQVVSRGQYIPVPGARHGLAMLTEVPSLKDTLVTFLRDPEHFEAPAAETAPPTATE